MWRWLDRVWLTAIALSFVVWLVLMIDRLGWPYVVGFGGLAFTFRHFRLE